MGREPRDAGARTRPLAYRIMWSGKAYSAEEAREARVAKAKYAQAA